MNPYAPLRHSRQRERGGMEIPMKMKCTKCEKPIHEVIPFCMDCAGYEPVSMVASGNYLIVTYKRPPTMWKDRDE